MRKFDGLEGLSFGITSGVITILGVLIGLSATGNKIFTEIGILIVGIADALSDATGMYVSEESEYVHTQKQINKTAFYTFFGKISTLALLLFPLILFKFIHGVLISFVLGISLISLLGYFIAKGSKRYNAKTLVVKYVTTTIFVSLVSYLVGNLASTVIQ